MLYKSDKTDYRPLSTNRGILSSQELYIHAKNLPKNHILSRSKRLNKEILTRLDNNFASISEVYKTFKDRSNKGIPVCPSSEWLLDNFYIIEEQVKYIHINCNKGFLKKLPVLDSGYLKGFSRTFAICYEIVRHTDGKVDKDQVVEFIKAYQTREVLTIAELWSIPIMLRIAVLERITDICHNAYDIQIEWDRIEELKSKSGEDILNEVINTLKEMSSINYPYIERLLRYVKHLDINDEKLIALVDEQVYKFKTSIEDVVRYEHNEQASMQVSMGNCITSLRVISSLNIKKIFENLSHVDFFLQKDPMGIYSLQDFESRDYYRREIEQISEHYGVCEVEVAKAALECSLRHKDNEGLPPLSHVGYYIVDEGKETLLKELKKSYKNNNTGPLTFFTPLIFITLALSLSLTVYSYVNASSSPFLFALITLIITLIPASEVGVTFSNWLTTHSVNPDFIPKLELKDGIPEEASTIVIVPTILSNVKRSLELVDNLEVTYRANNGKNIYFALVGDLKDCENDKNENDTLILTEVKEAIEKLNKTYGDDKFYFLARRRVYNEKQKRWMGWDRKRGAILEFNKFIKGDKATTFTTFAGNFERLKNIKYVLTIDADTIIPIDQAKKLVGSISHPLNRAIFDEKVGRVVKGYGLIQPRIGVTVESANKSLFTRIFAGSGGIDPYTSAVSDVYQDLFHEAIFTGKGIYDIDMFVKSLSSIPENTLLSHDLIEGSYLRTGLATDIELIDGYPEKYNSHMMRLHRWVRGDWQAIYWLMPFIKDVNGKKIKNPINSISKWKVFDNLRRSLVSTFLLLVILLGSLFLPGNPLLWLGFAILVLFLPVALGLGDYIILKNYSSCKYKPSANIIYGFRAAAYQCLLTLMLLPYHSYIMLSAILKTLYRVFISKRNMLEWVTAAEVEKNMSNDFKGYFRRMMPSLLIVIILLIALLPNNLWSLFLLLPVLILWALSPLIAYNISQPAAEHKYKLSSSDREFLIEVSKNTWDFYERFTNEENNYLPIDNYQEEPIERIAHRTSPTNIGFYLMAVLCAKDLNFITPWEMIEKIDRTLGTIEKMEKWNGHLYNWYDTTTLQVLMPKYISTVDSGNLAGYFITLKEALKELLKATDGCIEVEHVNSLISRIEVLIEEMRFEPLFDRERELFSIGYDVSNDKLTNSYYDLLASEARITSYLAIAKRVVSPSHWSRLGRSLVEVDGSRSLVSWTGTMFEYLMPPIIMKSYNNTLLGETYSSIVKAQIKYGRDRKVPWGTSESGYYWFDYILNYQYKAFGVPDLGLKRGLVNDMVVSPYSTILALPFNPESALKNMYEFNNYGLVGRYGLYEAVDFTPERMPRGQRYAIVKSFMAHHQGMIITAINNYLNDNILSKRFHSDPSVRAGEFLLQERIPVRAIITKTIKEEVSPFNTEEYNSFNYVRNLGLPESSMPACNLLSNGNYSIMVSDFGYSYSRFRDIMVTRWREDLSFKKFGTFIFLRDITSGKTWSSTLEPLNVLPDKYEVVFSSDKVKFARHDGTIETHTEVCVSPEDNCEVRKLTLFNHSSEDIVIECTSYQEPVLSPHMADVAHPAFNNLFIRTEWVSDYNSIIASRRPREEGKKTLWAFHSLSFSGETSGDIDVETDRYKFIGRGHNLRNPRSLMNPLTNSTGPILDPVMSIRKKVKVPALKLTVLYYTTGIAENRDSILELCRKYSEPSIAERSFELAYLRGSLDNSYFSLKESEVEIFDILISHILFISPFKKKYEEYISKSRKGQSGLWAYGISGDIPIVLVTISSKDNIDAVKTMLKAHEYWRSKGLNVDLVILNQEESNYFEPMMNLIRDEVYSSRERDLLDRPGGIFIKNAGSMPEEDKILLYSASRFILNADKGNIKKQLLSLNQVETSGRLLEVTKRPSAYTDTLDTPNLLYYNGYGGFDSENKEYVITLKGDRFTPAPWSNVIANKNFGFIVTDTGGGFTWSENSRENKITPWSNDPVSDTPGEVIYIRDDETGEAWTITPLPIRENETYIIRHGLGYSKFLHASHGINQNLTVFAAKEDPVKLSLIKLKNPSGNTRRLSVYYYIRPVMGVADQITQQHIQVEFDKDLDSFVIRNPYNSDFPGRLTFISSSLEARSFTGNRTEFIGNLRGLSTPLGLNLETLDNKHGSGYDPCCVIQTSIQLAADEEQDLVFMLGQVDNVNSLNSLVNKYKDIGLCKNSFKDSINSWDSYLNAVQVDTPDDKFNILMNTWLLYQTLSCRIWARSAFYQSGGAFGFRDQLQDVMSLLNTYPELAKEQIILHSAHQFLEGDVQHWWHPGAGEKGIRTRFSDDLLWLPYVTAEYVEKTGDLDVLSIEVQYLEDSPLGEHEDERYGIPRISEERGPVYEHCIRAIERGLKSGSHGIPLMGSGDWNDGMSTVGNKGRGESIWLGWFICHTLRKFIPLCTALGDYDRARFFEEKINEISDSIEKHAWDGEWYLRAYFDDGTPLGSSMGSECKIDSIAQSWSIISGAGNKERAEKAMNSVEKYLVSEDEGLIKLFTPPFDKGNLSPGYIRGYVPGVRENGGQYTHASTWVIYAFAKLGYGDKAYNLFNLINPINHTRTEIDCAKYKVEPYVIAADVYSVEPHVGRGGWTWYTGSSSWMYKVGLEEILGFKKKGDKLFIEPCIPSEWKEYSIRYQFGKASYDIRVVNAEGVNTKVKEIRVDGQIDENKSVYLIDDGKVHSVEVLLG
jgi:cyclic beta-1,2-glucan synthetase